MRRNSQILPLLIVIGAAGAFLLAAVVPVNRRLESARGEMQQIQTHISEQSEKLTALQTLHSEVEALRARTATFDRGIPTEHALGEFLRKLAEIVEKNGLENHIFQPRPAHAIEPGRLPPNVDAAIGGIHVQPVLIQCEGPFEALFGSVREIEAMPRLSEIDNLKVTGDPKRPGRVKVEILLNTFFRVPPRGPAAARGGP